ncbi:MAG: TlpA family protein disulfide reductase [Odoribacter sp.]|nr:TlpA family protein disulfide reductase [Odoribacter sp.]
MRFFWSCLFLSLTLGVFAQHETTLLYPKIESNLVQRYQEIYRITKTDTALLVQGNVYNRPNYWVQLDTGWLQGNVTGKRYRLVRSLDYPLGKRVGMPASGTREYTLQFELPAPEDRYVDYYDQDGTLLFKGIALYPEKRKGFCCMIRGMIQDNANCSRLVLSSYDTDVRVGAFISIPVRDGKFEYPFYTDERTVYTLASWHDYLNGSWTSKDLWVEPGTVEICFAPMAAEEKQTVFVSLTKLNKEMVRYEEWQKETFRDTLLFGQYERLEKEDRMYSDKMKEWLKSLEAEGVNLDSMWQMRDQMELNDEIYSPEMKVLNRKFDVRSQKMGESKLEYARKPSLNGLYLLTGLLRKCSRGDAKLDAVEMIKLYREKYQQKFSGHPLAERIEAYIGALEIKKGGRFIDFTAPDLEGRPVRLSEYIAGKVALIDLWASWCGSCRNTSQSMIPVYRDFKDKGFAIVGVARENGNTKAMENAIKKDGYPWLNLVELNDRGGIWYKYGAGNAGGMTLLVDRSGTILAVHPTAEEVRKILQDLLGQGEQNNE